MRAGYDPPAQAVARLRAAAGLASGHGSVALVRRCEDELRRRGTAPAGAAPNGPG